MIIVFCLWAIFPSWRGLLTPKVASIGAWGAVLALSLAILPLTLIQQSELDARAAARARYDAALAAVPNDAPLWELTPFLPTGNYTQVDQVLARVHKLDRRQADAETMLARGDFPLRYLGPDGSDAVAVTLRQGARVVGLARGAARSGDGEQQRTIARSRPTWRMRWRRCVG